MAISTTYILLQKAIADELGNRTDLLTALGDSGLTLSPIQNAIQSAVSKWEREPFYFNEIYNSATPLFTTVSAQELYTTADASMIATSPYIYNLHALISANRYEMRKRSWQEIEDLSSNPAARGQPNDWAYLAKTIRLYPIPDGAYPIRASRLQILTALSADADTNAWTNAGQTLIRYSADKRLYMSPIQAYDKAQAMEVAEKDQLQFLRNETDRRKRTGSARPYY